MVANGCMVVHCWTAVMPGGHEHGHGRDENCSCSAVNYGA